MWMEPDRILVGEVRGPEALDLLMSWNTGHEGGIATLHANNVAAGLTRLSTLVRMHRDAPREIEPLIRRSGRYRCPYSPEQRRAASCVTSLRCLGLIDQRTGMTYAPHGVARRFGDRPPIK